MENIEIEIIATILLGILFIKEREPIVTIIYFVLILLILIIKLTTVELGNYIFYSYITIIVYLSALIILFTYVIFLTNTLSNEQITWTLKNNKLFINNKWVPDISVRWSFMNKPYEIIKIIIISLISIILLLIIKQDNSQIIHKIFNLFNYIGSKDENQISEENLKNITFAIGEKINYKNIYSNNDLLEKIGIKMYESNEYVFQLFLVTILLLIALIGVLILLSP